MTEEEQNMDTMVVEDDTSSYQFGEFISSYSFPQSIHTIELNTTMDILLVNNFLYRIPSMERLLTIEHGPDEKILFSPCGEYFVNINQQQTSIMKMFHIDNKLEEVKVNSSGSLTQQDLLCDELIYDMEWIKLEKTRNEQQQHYLDTFLTKFDPNQMVTATVGTMEQNQQQQMIGLASSQQKPLEPTCIKFETSNNLLVLYLKNQLLDNNYSAMLYLNGKLPIVRLKSLEYIKKVNYRKKDLNIDKFGKSLNILPIMECITDCKQDIIKIWSDFFSNNSVFVKLEHLDIFELISTRLNYINLELFASVGDSFYSKLLTSFNHVIDRIDQDFSLIFSYLEYLISNLNDLDMQDLFLLINDEYYDWKVKVCENVKSILKCLSDIQLQKSNIYPNVESNFKSYNFEKFNQCIENLESKILHSHYFNVLEVLDAQKHLKFNYEYCKNSSEYYYYVADNTLYIFNHNESSNLLPGDDGNNNRQEQQQPIQIICGLVDETVDEIYLYKENRFIVKTPHTILYIYDNNIHKYLQFEDEITKFTISTIRNLFAICVSSNDRLFSVYEITD